MPASLEHGGEGFEALARVHRADRVVRRVDDDRARLRRDGLGQRVDVDLEARHQSRHLDELATARVNPVAYSGKYGEMTITSSPGSVTAAMEMAMPAAAPAVR